MTEGANCFCSQSTEYKNNKKVPKTKCCVCKNDFEPTIHQHYAKNIRNLQCPSCKKKKAELRKPHVPKQIKSISSYVPWAPVHKNSVLNNPF